MEPFYPLKDVKALLKANHYQLNDPPLQDAHNHFMWGPKDIKKCLLRLNDKLHKNDPEKNHYHKTEQHREFPATKMDYYKIRNAPEGNMVYTHFYIRGFDGKLIISSFKRL